MNELDGALCSGNWRLFDSTDLADHREAKERCARCPAIDACRRLFDTGAGGQRHSNPVGTWAGRLYGRPGGKVRHDIECGTDSGYHRHRSQKQVACDDCKAAHAAHWLATNGKEAG